eukprot:5785931-Amphidinium_carterae.2
MSIAKKKKMHTSDLITTQVPIKSSQAPMSKFIRREQYTATSFSSRTQRKTCQIPYEDPRHHHLRSRQHCHHHQQQHCSWFPIPYLIVLDKDYVGSLPLAILEVMC